MPNFKSQNSNLINFTVLLILALFTACASIQTPQGGPKDTQPPKVLKIEPENLSKNFKAEKILIEFDEYFKLQDQFKEVSISPEQEKPPVLKIKKKYLEITFKDSLEKNTTYTINFGKSIADVNEGNVLKNFSYVFSTGSHLDSLSISGKVSNALTGETEKDVLVFILPLSRDTLFGKKRPSIYALTDSSGHYQLNNLRKDTYKIYALKEQGGDKIYQQNTDEIGFLKDSLKLETNLNNIDLKTFKEKPSEFKVSERKINPDGTLLLTFNLKLKKPDITITEPSNLDAQKKLIFNKTNDSARIWLKEMAFDSVKLAVKDNGKILQTVTLTRGKKDTYTRTLIPADNISSGHINPNSNLELSFPLPLENADKAKITLLEDSVSRTNFELLKDSSNFLKYSIKYSWKNKRKYDIKFAEGAFTGLANTRNKEFSKRFEPESPDSYGSLALKIMVPDTTKNYIVEFLNQKKEIIRQNPVNKNSTLVYNKYLAGIYFIRVVYDRNKNGEWDTGNVAKGIQPEKIWYADKEMSLRANWDREEILTIPKEEEISQKPAESPLPKKP